MKKWQTTLHGSMMIVMLGNSLPAYAQQGVTIKNGGDVMEGTVNDSPCANPTASTCTVGALLRLNASAIEGPIPPQGYTVPIGAVGALVNTNNASAVLHVCGNYTTLAMSLNTTLQLVGLTAGSTIFICDYLFSNSGTATNINLVTGTGTNCASGSAVLDITWYLAANEARIAANPFYRGLNAGAGNALCLQSSATATLSFGIYYDKY